MAITQTITTYTDDVPDKDTMTPEEFDVAAQDWVEYQTDIAPEVNTWSGQANTLATTVNSDAVSALSSKSDAESAANISTASANFKGEWDDLTGALSVPASVYHDSIYWMLLSDLADVTAKEPGVDVEWVHIAITPLVVNKTTTGNLTTLDVSLKTIHNDGAGAEVILTWPTLATGQEATFYVNDAQYLQIKAPAGVTIRAGVIQTAAAGYFRSNEVGSYIQIKAMPDELVVLDFGGVWNYDQ